MLKYLKYPACFRLVDRYLVNGYKPQRLSTYALSLFRHRMKVNDEDILIGVPDKTCKS